jgi:hypothetical protein
VRRPLPNQGSRTAKPTSASGAAVLRPTGARRARSRIRMSRARIRRRLRSQSRRRAARQSDRLIAGLAHALPQPLLLGASERRDRILALWRVSAIQTRPVLIVDRR